MILIHENETTIKDKNVGLSEQIDTARERGDGRDVRNNKKP